MDLPPRPPSPMLAPDLDLAVREVLGRLPNAPREAALFSSNTLFGEPGIHPEGPPMLPADGDAPDDHLARAALATLLPDHLGEPAAVAQALGLFDEPTLHRVAPAPQARAALVLLCGTVAAPVLEAVVGGRCDTPFREVSVAEMPGSGRVVGPDPAHPDDPGARAVNDRYRAEHPALLAPSLAHDLLWSGDGDDQFEEATLHAVLAMVHLQIVARSPWVAHLGTELARRQNSLALTLLGSRHPGHAALAVRAPDGVGTIPGGAPGLQSPDFWSIPFASARDTGRSAPAVLSSALGAASVDVVPSPLRYDAVLADVLLHDLGWDWLAPVEQLRAAIALGVTDVDAVARAAGLGRDAAVRTLGLAAADACWRA